MRLLTIREIVAGLTSNRRAISAADRRPESTASVISRRCLSLSQRGLPPTRPSSFAAASPARVRSRIIDLSNSAKLPSIVMQVGDGYHADNSPV